MIESILYIILALLGISFLIFIHELGHYFMARKVGITVEAFAIGFGKPLIQWERDGVKWRIGWLPFGGYVKMAGMERQGSIEPSEIKTGFFGARPWPRIKVAFMGPLMNILFTLVAFTFLWMIGGRDKPFSEFTHYIGWVEKSSDLYKAEIRPGDEINKLNGRAFKNFNDLLYGAVLDKPPLRINGYKINYISARKTPFTYTFDLNQDLDGMAKAAQAIQSIRPAQYLIYERMPSGKDNPILPQSPMEHSGVSYGDRILWVDGEPIFSNLQLSQIVNSRKVLLTIDRDGKTFLARVPRLAIRDLRLTKGEKEELDDWRHEAKLGDKVDELAFIPYNLSSSAVVENSLGYIDSKSQSKSYFEPHERTYSENPLQRGDKIIAVQGQKVISSYELFEQLQTIKTLIIVKKTPASKPISWKEADQGFEASFDMADLEKIVQSIGTSVPITQMGAIRLLSPVTPVPFHEFPLDDRSHKARQEKLEKHQKEIEDISDQTQKEKALKGFELYQNRLMLGLNLQDKTVAYNPSPFILFGDVFKETYRTLFALITGYLSPKHLAGPVGIVQVIHHGWSVGAKEALFWLGMISLNLGLINLLPIPVLDGGYILFAIIESITKKPLKAKTMERLIFPFIVLIIAFFIYLTYHDLFRLISRFF